MKDAEETEKQEEKQLGGLENGQEVVPPFFPENGGFQNRQKPRFYSVSRKKKVATMFFEKRLCYKEDTFRGATKMNFLGCFRQISEEMPDKKGANIPFISPLVFLFLSSLPFPKYIFAYCQRCHSNPSCYTNQPNLFCCCFGKPLTSTWLTSTLVFRSRGFPSRGFELEWSLATSLEGFSVTSHGERVPRTPFKGITKGTTPVLRSRWSCQKWVVFSGLLNVDDIVKKFLTKNLLLDPQFF